MKKSLSFVLSLIMIIILTVTPYTSLAEEAVKQEGQPAVASSIELNKKVINASFSGDYLSTFSKLKLSVTFPENAEKCNDIITVKSSNPKVAKCDSKEYYFKRNKTKKVELNIYGLGTTILTFTNKAGLKATCKVNVNKLYALRLTGKKTIPYFKINGKKTKSWKSSNPNIIKAKKAGFVCLKRSDKSVVLSKKIKGKTYRVFVLPQTKHDLESVTKKQLLIDYKGDKKEEELVGKSKYKFSNKKYYYYWVRTYDKENLWESGRIYNSPKGLISMGMSR